MVSVKRMFWVLSVMLWSVVAFAQRIDTIHIGKIRSSVPITGKVADLQYLFDGKGKWHYGACNIELEYYPYHVDDSLIYVYHVNWISEKKTKTAYNSDKDGNIRLRYLDFKLARGSYVGFPRGGFRLSYNTTLDEFIKFFNITDTIEFGSAVMAPWNYYMKSSRIWKKYCAFGFYTDEGRRTTIRFYFDHKRHLRCVELDYFNADNVEVRSLR